MKERYYEYVPITEEALHDSNVYAKRCYSKDFYKKAVFSSILSIAALLSYKTLINRTPILLYICSGLAILNMIQAFIALHRQKTYLLTREIFISNIREQVWPRVAISLGTGIIIQCKDINREDVGHAEGILDDLESTYGRRNTLDYIRAFLTSKDKKMYSFGVIYLDIINEAVVSGHNRILDSGEDFFQYIEMEEI